MTVASSSINKTGRLVVLVALLMQNSRRPRGRCFVGQRQAHDKRGADAVGVVVTSDFSTVLANNSVTNTQAQTRAFAHPFRGEERIEDALRVLDAVAVVAENRSEERRVGKECRSRW